MFSKWEVLFFKEILNLICMFFFILRFFISYLFYFSYFLRIFKKFNIEVNLIVLIKMFVVDSDRNFF